MTETMTTTTKTVTCHLVIKHSEDDLEAFVCTSLDHQVSAESRRMEEAINFVKGASLSALGELWKEIPNDVHIKFEIDQSAVESNEAEIRAAHCDYQTGVTPGVIACKQKLAFVCGCSRCGSEQEDGKFHSCADHRAEVEERHAHIYPRHRVVWYGIR